jgi:hypothetical protein
VIVLVYSHRTRRVPAAPSSYTVERHIRGSLPRSGPGPGRVSHYPGQSP